MDHTKSSPPQLDKPAAVPARPSAREGAGESRSKIVRDGFSMPEEDYRLIDEIKASCLNCGVIVTKSGILRAALRALNKLSAEEQAELLQSLVPIKTGRPPVQK